MQSNTDPATPLGAFLPLRVCIPTGLIIGCVFLQLLFGSGCKPSEAMPDPLRLRLASTAPNLTECIFAAGAGPLLVARTECCDYPPEAQALPITGGFGTPWLEPLLATHATHLLETVLADPGMEQHLAELKINVVHVPCTRLGDIAKALRQIGQLAESQAQAEQCASVIESGLQAAQTELAQTTHRPRVLLLFAPDSPITAGSNAFVAELLELAGGINLGSCETTPYYRISLEWVLTQDPDLLICLFETTHNAPLHFFEQQIGWKSLRAVQAQRVYVPSDLNTISRPGPRVLDGLKQFKTILARDAIRELAASTPPVAPEATP